MAIIDLIPGLEISIAVDGIALPEYEDEIDEDGMRGPQHRPVARRYVESSSDKEFAIQLKLHDPYRMEFDSLLFYISIDGKPMAKPVISKDQYPLFFRGDIVKKTIKRTVEGATVSGDEMDQYRLRKFRFSKIEMSSDDAMLASVEADSKSMKDVGEIEVKIYRAIQPQVALGTEFSLDSKSFNVHERALKGQAKSHNTSLGPAIKPVQTSFVNCAKIDELFSPYAVLKFKYRSRQALKSLMIIDRTPSPEPGSRTESHSEHEIAAPVAPVDLNNLDETQRSRVQQFLQGMTASSTHSTSPTPGRTIKREHENGEDSVLRKKSRTREKVTIDLTLDSDDE